MCPNLIVLIGIQGSGKSRWTLSHSEFYRVCPDEIRKKYYDDISNQTDNSSVYAIARGMIITVLELGQDTVIDATNVNTLIRREFFKKLPLHNRHAKVFETKPEIAIQRIRKDIKDGVIRADVPDHAVYRYYGDFLYTEKALLEEEFVTIRTVP